MTFPFSLRTRLIFLSLFSHPPGNQPTFLLPSHQAWCTWQSYLRRYVLDHKPKPCCRAWFASEYGLISNILSRLFLDESVLQKELKHKILQEKLNDNNAEQTSYNLAKTTLIHAIRYH